MHCIVHHFSIISFDDCLPAAPKTAGALLENMYADILYTWEFKAACTLSNDHLSRPLERTVSAVFITPNTGHDWMPVLRR